MGLSLTNSLVNIFAMMLFGLVLIAIGYYVLQSSFRDKMKQYMLSIVATALILSGLVAVVFNNFGKLIAAIGYCLLCFSLKDRLRRFRLPLLLTALIICVAGLPVLLPPHYFPEPTLGYLLQGGIIVGLLAMGLLMFTFRQSSVSFEGAMTGVFLILCGLAVIAFGCWGIMYKLCSTGMF